MNFQKTINDPAYITNIQCYGALDDDVLVRMIATRNGGAHITLFFVEEAYHHKGVGSNLFQAMLTDNAAKEITVNSSPYAVPVYMHLGFTATKPEQETDGIRYTPMVYRRQVELSRFF